LSEELEDKRYLPIVILSDVDSYILNKVEPLGRILFTKNIYLGKNNKKTVEEFNTKNLKNLTEDEYKIDFLNRIAVEEYGDNTNRHSIANEWAICQWANQLDVSTVNIGKIKDKVSSMLYFKYLTKKYNLEKKHNISITKSNINGKILLIDDKWQDGWKDIMNGFCKAYYSGVEFDTLEEEIKNRDIKEIETLAIEKIKQFDPHIILLDLRLQKDENENSKNKKTISKISGIKLLKVIKTFNPSIQIIVFTASSNSLILDELYKNNVLGYIKKDSPEDRYITPKTNLKKLDTMIKGGLEKKYLKDIWAITEDLSKLNFLEHKDKSKINELKISIKSVFEILNSDISKSFLYAMLSIYKSIEIINSLYIKEKNLDIFWIDTKKTLPCYNSTENKLLEILDKKLHIKDADLEKKLRQIVCCRNYSIHAGHIKEKCSEVHIEKLKSEHILSWFKMLKKILDKIYLSKYV
jgi:CheY-like chemotaxis protein